MIDLMVLAKSLSSLTDTQMINKLDHAKSEKGEKRKKRRVRKKEVEKKKKTQRKGEKQSKGAQGGKRERREEGKERKKEVEEEGKEEGDRERKGRQEGKPRWRRTHYEYETYSIMYNLNPESHKRLWGAGVEQHINHKKNAASQC